MSADTFRPSQYHLVSWVRDSETGIYGDQATGWSITYDAIDRVWLVMDQYFTEVDYRYTLRECRADFQAIHAQSRGWECE